MNNVTEQRIYFSKMHGLGNDFMIVDAITQNVFFYPKLIRHLANRHLGIGFDQLLIVEPPYDPEIDFHYRIFNADGSEVFQCGNGARCFALFVRSQGLTNKQNIHISTQNSRLMLNINNEGLISVDMGKPNFEPHLIPFRANKSNNLYSLKIGKENIIFDVVSIGNPHCVIQVNKVEIAPVEILGPVLEKHEIFPEGVNISFMEIVNSGYIRLRVYERGVGETQACGSGACAAVACGIKQGLLDNKVSANLLNGILHISWKGSGKSLIMSGPATHVYDGCIYL